MKGHLSLTPIKKMQASFKIQILSISLPKRLCGTAYSLCVESAFSMLGVCLLPNPVVENLVGTGQYG